MRGADDPLPNPASPCRGLLDCADPPAVATATARGTRLVGPTGEPPRRGGCGGQRSSREPGRLGHRCRAGHRARRRVLRRGGNGPGLAARGAGALDPAAGQARPAGGEAGAGSQPVPVLGPDRRHRGHPAYRRVRRRHPGWRPEVDAGKRQLREVLVPRTEVEFIAASTPLDRAAKIAAAAPYSRFPVYQESYDDIIGFVHVRDLLNPDLAGRPVPVGEVCRPVKQLPTSKRVLSALSEMRRDRAHMAIVVDEYGGTAGIVTLEDLVEELIGEITDEYDVEESARTLAGGQVEVDGLLNLDELAEQTGVAL